MSLNPPDPTPTPVISTEAARLLRGAVERPLYWHLPLPLLLLLPLPLPLLSLLTLLSPLPLPLPVLRRHLRAKRKTPALAPTKS